MHRKIRTVRVLALAILLVLATGAGALAADSDPLLLSSSTPVDGATNVPVPSEIKLTFNKNVVNMSVKENNLTCFSLSNAAGNALPVTVVLADDQVEPEKKNDVRLVPKSALGLGEKYTVTVAAALKSKSGDTLGSAVVISFTTSSTAALPTTGAALGLPLTVGLGLFGTSLVLRRFRR